MFKLVSQIINMDAFSALRTLDLNEFRSKFCSDLTVLGANGQTLLHEAIARRKFDIAELLINLGIQLDTQANNGKTALHYAAEFLTFEVAKLLLSKGASLSFADNYGNQPLWTVVLAEKGKYKISCLLIEAGADPTHKNKLGRSVIDFAIQTKNEDLLNLIKA